MKEVHYTDGVLIWTEIHHQRLENGEGDSLDDCLDAWLIEPVEPATRLARIDNFLITIGEHKNKFVTFHAEGLREQIATIRKKTDAPNEWVLKQVEEAENRVLTLIHLLRDSNRKSQIASGHRPNRVDQLRERIKKIMSIGRKNDHSFDEVLFAWRHDPIDGLRLMYVRETDSYLVDDENSDMSERKYTHRQFRSIFSESS